MDFMNNYLNMRKFLNFLFLIALLSCELWAADSDKKELYRLVEQLRSSQKYSDEWNRTINEMTEFIPKAKAVAISIGIEHNINIDDILSGAFSRSTANPKLIASSFDFPEDLRKDYLALNKKPKLPAAQTSQREVSKEFEGQGHALCQEDAIFDKEGNAPDDIYKELDNIWHKFYLDNALKEALKKSNIQPDKILNLINLLKSKKSPREAREELNNFFIANKPDLKQEPLIPNSAGADGPKFDAPAKSSKPRAGAGNDEPRIIKLEDFLNIGRKKGIEDSLIIALFKALQESKIIETFDFFEGLPRQEALKYIDQKTKTEEKNEHEEQKNHSLLRQIDEHLLALGVSPMDRGYILKLGRRLLDRNEPRDILNILDIAGFLAGLHGNGPRDSVALVREKVDELCIAMADLKIERKFLEQFRKSLSNHDYRNKKIMWIADVLKKNTSIDVVAKLLLESLISEAQEIDDFSEIVVEKDIGLRNSFSNCYLNSVMQVMAKLNLATYIRKALDINNYPPQMQNKKNMHEKLWDFFKGMKGEESTFNPRTDASDKLRRFLKENGDAPQDDLHSQQDAQENFLKILERLSEGDAQFKKFNIHLEYIDIIDENLRSIIEDEARRVNLLSNDETVPLFVKRKTEVTSMLSLDIENNDMTDLQTCFSRFLKEETCDMLYWPTSTPGKEINLLKLFGYALKAKRVKKISELPKILVIHLKRFRNQGNEIRKIDNNILFPLDFEADDYITTENHLPHYNFRGAIFHAGLYQAGHYWACVKDRETKEYFLYNDLRKQKISDDEMRTLGNIGKSRQDGVEGTAYMLFYEAEKVIKRRQHDLGDEEPSPKRIKPNPEMDIENDDENKIS